MDKLNLVIPHWYGSTDSRIARGCRLIASQIHSDDCVILNEVQGLPVSNPNIQNYGLVLDSLQKIKSTLEMHQPKEVFTIGGDCGIELPLVSYVASLYGDEMGIVWIDSHADANTPETSPSKTFHGMPMRCLCGEGDKCICDTGFSCINPNTLVYMGLRDLDDAEVEWIQKNKIPTLNDTGALIGFLKERKFKKVFIHLNLDALEPTEFPEVACPTADGLNVKQVVDLLEKLAAHFHIVGATLTECVANEESSLTPIKPILMWWKQHIL